MPFSIRKIGKNKYQVYNTATGEIHSKGTSKKKAEGQFRLLQGVARKEVVGLEGGAKRSRTEAQWEEERNNIQGRLDALENRLDGLQYEDTQVVNHQLPALPPELLRGNSQFVMKFEIYAEFIASLAQDRDVNYSDFSPHQRILIYQWLNTIPYSITRDFLERDRLKDEITAEMDEEGYDLHDVRDTRARENTMAPAPDDEQTEKEGYGRRGLKGGINPRHLRQALAKSKLYTIDETLTGEDARKVAPLKRQLVSVYDKIASLDKELQERISIKKLQRLEEYKQRAIELEGQIKEIYDRLPDEEDLQGMGMRGGWTFSNRSYNPLTLGYNALLNGMTENYRSDITKEGVRQDVDRNIEQVKKFAKNPNPITFAKNEAEGQFSRYGSGYPANPSDYQPRRFL